jgi:hypothetical protein
LSLQNQYSVAPQVGAVIPFTARFASRGALNGWGVALAVPVNITDTTTGAASSGTLRTFANGDITSVDVGQTYTQHDVTGFGDAAQNFINGQLQAPVTLKGFVTTTANIGTHPVISGAFAAGATVTLQVDVGLNAAPVNGNPRYTGEFIIESYKPMLDKGSAVTFEAMLKPATGAAPVWTVVS